MAQQTDLRLKRVIFLSLARVYKKVVAKIVIAQKLDRECQRVLCIRTENARSKAEERVKYDLIVGRVYFIIVKINELEVLY